MTLFLSLLLCLAGALHMAAFELVGRSDLPPTGIAADTSLGIALALLAVSVLRKRLPGRSPASVEYYMIAGIGGVAGPTLVLLFALPHLRAGVSVPILMLAIISAAALPAVRRGRAAGFAALTAIIVAAILLASGTETDAMRWLAAAIAASVMSGTILSASLAIRPVGEDLIGSATGIAIAATVVITIMNMATGEVIDLVADWRAGASFVPVMVALGLAEAGICAHAARHRAGMRWLRPAAAAPLLAIAWLSFVGGIRVEPMIWGATLILALCFFAQLSGRGE